jgi:hypothetical protein
MRSIPRPISRLPGRRSQPSLLAHASGPLAPAARRRMPREGSASSSPTILKLCSRPSFLRRVQSCRRTPGLGQAVAWRLLRSRAALANSALPARRPQQLPCHLCLLRPGAPLRTGRERPRLRQARLRSRNCGEAISAGQEVRPSRFRLL